MEIREYPLSELKPYEKNPRLNDGAVKYLVNSIREFGFKQPIVISQDKVIVCGHTRWKAAQELKLEKVPCIVADDLSEEKLKAYRLVDNKISEISEWDMALLNEEMDALAEFFDFGDFGFEVDTEAPVLNDDSDFDVEKAAESIKEPVTRPGDIYRLGNHRLICGDSCDAATVAKLLDGRQVDLYLTDPPYNVAYGSRGKTYKERGGYECGCDDRTILNDDMDEEAFLAFLCDAFAAADSVMKPGCPFYIFHASCEVENFYKAVHACPEWMPKQYLLWVKDRFTLGRQDYQWRHEPAIYGWKNGASHYFVDDRKQSTVLEFDKPSANKEHPTMKPVELFERLVENSSLPGNNVLDSFGGSGTTIIACEKLGRNGFSCELDPKYCDVIVQRWEALTGRKAELVRNGDVILDRGNPVYVEDASDGTQTGTEEEA